MEFVGILDVVGCTRNYHLVRSTQSVKYNRMQPDVETRTCTSCHWKGMMQQAYDHASPIYPYHQFEINEFSNAGVNRSFTNAFLNAVLFWARDPLPMDNKTEGCTCVSTQNM
jgi:hypothetical protein